MPVIQCSSPEKKGRNFTSASLLRTESTPAASSTPRHQAGSDPPSPLSFLARPRAWAPRGGWRHCVEHSSLGHTACRSVRVGGGGGGGCVRAMTPCPNPKPSQGSARDGSMCRIRIIDLPSELSVALQTQKMDRKGHTEKAPQPFDQRFRLR